MVEIRNDVKEYTTIPWEQFKDYEFNALKPFNDRDVQKMKNAIINRGFKFPFYVWAGHRYVIDGAGRRKALLELQAEGHAVCDIPVIMIDAPNYEAAKEMVLMASSAHGRVTQDSFDEFVEGLSLQALQEMIEIPDIGFNTDEVKIEKMEPEGDPDDVPNNKETDQPFTQLGDIYDIGGHRLICGDTLDQTSWENVLEGEVADMCFTSPPYNVGGSAHLANNADMPDNKYQDHDDEVSQEDYRDFLCEFTTSALLYSKLAIINIQQLAGNKVAFLEWLYMYRQNFVDMAIWDKGNGPAPAMANNVMSSRFEYLVMLTHAENPSRAIPGAKFRGTVHNLYQGEMQRNNEHFKAHSATFPTHLPEWIINSFLDGKTIIDPFGGTGTTMIAAQKLGKRCFMIEKNPMYCDIVVARMKQTYPSIKVIHNNQTEV